MGHEDEKVSDFNQPKAILKRRAKHYEKLAQKKEEDERWREEWDQVFDAIKDSISHIKDVNTRKSIEKNLENIEKNLENRDEQRKRNRKKQQLIDESNTVPFGQPYKLDEVFKAMRGRDVGSEKKRAWFFANPRRKRARDWRKDGVGKLTGATKGKLAETAQKELERRSFAQLDHTLEWMWELLLQDEREGK